MKILKKITHLIRCDEVAVVSARLFGQVPAGGSKYCLCVGPYDVSAASYPDGSKALWITGGTPNALGEEPGDEVWHLVLRPWMGIPGIYGLAWYTLSNHAPVRRRPNTAWTGVSQVRKLHQLVVQRALGLSSN